VGEDLAQQKLQPLDEASEVVAGGEDSNDGALAVAERRRSSRPRARTSTRTARSRHSGFATSSEKGFQHE
jgi:hypothetical protein